MTTKLSVVIPCFNEERRVIGGIKHYYSYLKKTNYSWQLILVNDGSSDNTENLMQIFAKRDKRIRIVSYKKNHGKGYAISQGVKLATGNIILFSDLDHSVPINSINTFFRYFEKGYSAVIGSRRIKGSKFIKKQPLIREMLGIGFSTLVRLIIDFRIKDTTCGFKAFEKSVAHKLFRKITVYRWAFDAELIFLCKKYKINLTQAPVAWKDVRGSKVSLKKDIADSFVGLLKIRLYDLQGKY